MTTKKHSPQTTLDGLAIERWETHESASGPAIRFPIIAIAPYKEGGVPEGNCAGYARRVAHGVFGVEYVGQEAWDYRYTYETIEVERFKDLRKHFRSGELKAGYMVGFFNPESSRRFTQKDRTGRLAAYTHMAVLLGENPENELLFGQQVIKERVVSSDREMDQRGFKPVEVILPYKRDKPRRKLHSTR